MANPVDMVKYLFGVRIIARDEVLYIEDRRPTFKTFIAWVFVSAIIAVAGWGWLSGSLKIDAISMTGSGVALAIALYFTVRSNFRETYVFNKKADSFVFTRQSLLRKDEIEGSASQFRAVQVELRTRHAGDDREYYMVALLCQGPLFGQSQTQILREDPPMLNTRASANCIASAISKFLGIPRQGVVEVL
jgi:hypothetical protein